MISTSNPPFPPMLGSLGVTNDALTGLERETLDESGYLALPGLFSVEAAEHFKRLLDLLDTLEGEEAGLEVHQEKGTARLSNLVEKHTAFWQCFSHPKVLAAVAHVLSGDMKLSSLNSRAALPGQGLQGLHADWGCAVEPGDYQVCNSIWLVDDFTQENGATRAIPGSHRWGTFPKESLSDVFAPHPQEKLFIYPRGTVIVFNSHTWHGGTLNRTSEKRRAMHCYFGRRQHPQQTNQRQHLSPVTIGKLSEAQRWLLDV